MKAVVIGEPGVEIVDIEDLLPKPIKFWFESEVADLIDLIC